MKNREDHMTMTRRHMLAGAVAVPTVVASARLGSAAPARTLKLAHPFRGGGERDDLRDRLCRSFAAELEKRTDGEIAVQVTNDPELRDSVGQFTALRKGGLDFNLIAISDPGKEFPELDIGIMPGLVSSYKQGAAWKSLPVGQRFGGYLAERGVVMLSWIWLAGGWASRRDPVVEPQDAKDLKIRSGHHQMDEVLHAVGATTTSVRTNAMHAGMKEGSLDAAITSSTSLMAFGLEEIAKGLTTGRQRTYWYILVPLIMSKQTFDSFSRKHQEATLALGAEMERFATAGAVVDDQRVVDLYAKHGAKVADLNEAAIDKWRAIARTTAWKNYAEKTALSAELIRLAERVPAD
jgi:TRAP-type C4-dicarboxylate transport system substrate-binding protein